MRRPTSYRNALNPSSKTKARLTGGPGSAPCYSSCATSLRPAISRSVTANGSRGWRSSSSTTAAGRACVRTFFAVLVCPPTARRYASLKTGHVTASVALKRLVGFSAKNRFYRANRDLGRIFKTEFILQYLSEPELRRRIRRGSIMRLWQTLAVCSSRSCCHAMLEELERMRRKALPAGNENHEHSGPNHRENHLVALQRLERVRLPGGHENHLAALDPMQLAGDGDFGFSFQDLDQRIERCCVFAYALPFVESKDRHSAGRLLHDFATHNRAILVGHKISDLDRHFGFESFWFHN